jgi:putative ubiquitin-RnfH superfamily antitoxin RatB of RatAB toxin-antitoxin module
MKIEIAVSTSSRQTELLEWLIKDAPTVEQALVFLSTQSGLFASKSALGWQTAVWGKPVELTHTLKDGDRLEVLRPLRVDPKVARRERFQKQGAKTAGLFAKRRAGAKPGY